MCMHLNQICSCCSYNQCMLLSLQTYLSINPMLCVHVCIFFLSFFASEIIRSVLFEKLGKELPYCCEVRVTEFKEPKPHDKKPIIRMMATIFVERDSQKGIVVGKGGQKVKDVGIVAREKLESFFQTKVHLDLSVKVDKDWRKDKSKLKAYGYIN
mmetsp:Transcript_59142/g.87838  ORF Transcript_59142/g.87838 Transcript_59142/m.87838 type:complete len:155 (+) Transcript_59142:235-699(+)